MEIKTFKIERTNAYDLVELAKKIKSFNYNYGVLKAIIKGRKELFGNMHREYPNMLASAIVDRLSKQEIEWAEKLHWDLQGIRIGFANFKCEIGVIEGNYDIVQNIVEVLKSEGNEIADFNSLTF